ncbi:hypothetical protein V2W45_1240503, partial [Cenococcum geophilum]
VQVPYFSEVYDMVVLWVVSQPFTHKARSSLAHLGRLRYGDDDGAEEKPLSYLPWNARLYFF